MIGCTVWVNMAPLCTFCIYYLLMRDTPLPLFPGTYTPPPTPVLLCTFDGGQHVRNVVLNKSTFGSFNQCADLLSSLLFCCPLQPCRGRQQRRRAAPGDPVPDQRTSSWQVVPPAACDVSPALCPTCGLLFSSMRLMVLIVSVLFSAVRSPEPLSILTGSCSVKVSASWPHSFGLRFSWVGLLGGGYATA